MNDEHIQQLADTLDRLEERRGTGQTLKQIERNTSILPRLSRLQWRGE